MLGIVTADHQGARSQGSPASFTSSTETGLYRDQSRDRDGSVGKNEGVETTGLASDEPHPKQ